MATASMVIGIIGLFLFLLFGWILGPLGIIFGIIGINERKKRAISGIIMGSFVLFLWIMIIALPYYQTHIIGYPHEFWEETGYAGSRYSLSDQELLIKYIQYNLQPKEKKYTIMILHFRGNQIYRSDLMGTHEIVQSQEKFVKDLQDKGFDAYIVKGVSYDNLCVGHYYHKTEAESDLEKLKRYFPEAYVTKKSI